MLLMDVIAVDEGWFQAAYPLSLPQGGVEWNESGMIKAVSSWHILEHDVLFIGTSVG